jgi:hypothetical protein
MVTTILRIINLLVWIGLTCLTWYAVNPGMAELLFGIALNCMLCLITDYVIRVIRSEVAKGV